MKVLPLRKSSLFITHADFHFIFATFTELSETISPLRLHMNTTSNSRKRFSSLLKHDCNQNKFILFFSFCETLSHVYKPISKLSLLHLDLSSLSITNTYLDIISTNPLKRLIIFHFEQLQFVGIASSAATHACIHHEKL